MYLVFVGLLKNVRVKGRVRKDNQSGVQRIQWGVAQSEGAHVILFSRYLLSVSSGSVVV